MKPAELFGHKLTKLKNKSSDHWALPECTIGIELEYECLMNKLIDTGIIQTGPREELTLSSNYRYLSAHWSFHTDHSLRNYGIEFVSSPLFGEDLLDAIQLLNEFFDDLGNNDIVPTITSRCGTHIHLDVRDLDKEELLSLVCLYALYEYILFDFWGAERKHSIYCVPLNHTDILVGPLANMHYFKDDFYMRDVFESSFSEEQRYCALNLASIQKYGSLEFRHGLGTEDTAKLINWIQIIMCLKKYIIGKSLKEIVRDITIRDFEELSRQVFGEFYNTLFSMEDFSYYKATMFDGKHNIKTIFLGALKNSHDDEVSNFDMFFRNCLTNKQGLIYTFYKDNMIEKKGKENKIDLVPMNDEPPAYVENYMEESPIEVAPRPRHPIETLGEVLRDYTQAEYRIRIVDNLDTTTTGTDTGNNF